jgi:hypothetical protein
MKYTYSIVVLALLGKASASQIERHLNYKQADSFDRDPDTASMYDDQHVYAKPGENWANTSDEKKAAAKENAAAKAGAPANADSNESGSATEVEAALVQNKHHHHH